VTAFPSLPDLLQVLAAAGSLVGAMFGLALGAGSDREVLDDVIRDAALGALRGTLAAIAAWVVARLGAL
jgi:hypothetical protein